MFALLVPAPTSPVSIRATRGSNRASSRAIAAPTSPAPTITTSKSTLTSRDGTQPARGSPGAWPSAADRRLDLGDRLLVVAEVDRGHPEPARLDVDEHVVDEQALGGADPVPRAAPR